MRAGEKVEHGGALRHAIARFGGEPADWLDLSTGISPIPFPLPEIPREIWQRLPDPLAADEVAAAARDHYGAAVRPVTTPGSQAAIQHLPMLARALMPNAKGVAILAPTYGEYRAAFRRGGYGVDLVTALDDAAGHDAAVIVNPNNPDGRRIDADALIAFAERRGGRLTVVDEAFADMHREVSVIAAAGRVPGLVVLRSFGKFFGMAGLRLGFAFADPDPAGRLAHALGPWAVSGPALAIAAHAFARPELVAKQREAIEASYRLTRQALEAAGLKIVGGTGLFLLIEVDDASGLRDRLAAQHILTRAFDYNEKWLRIGLVADAEEAGRLAAALGAAGWQARAG